MNIDREVICQNCGVKFITHPSYIKRGQMRCCSRLCADNLKVKRPCILYDGDFYYRENRNGYYLAHKWLRLHRKIWSDHNGPIPDKHIIHHKDGDVDNNNLSNLELIDWGHHTAIHHIGHKSYRQRKICHCGQPAVGRGLCAKHYQRIRAQERGYWL